MHRSRSAALLIPLLIIALAVSSYWVESRRSSQRSALSGFFESQPTEIASRVQGRVVEICVKEGDAVKRGQVLLRLETAALKQDELAREAQAAQAEQQLLEVEHGPRPEDTARQEGIVLEARADLARLQNGPLPEEIGQAKARLMHAEAEYKNTLDGPRPQEIAQARAAERNSAAHLAQMQRGLTPEERAEAKARWDSAVSAEEFAKREAQRYADLFQQDAVSRQQADQKQTDYQTAQAKTREMEQAWKLADTGTPKEEMEQARQAHQQTVDALNLLLAGSRPEEIRAAADNVQEARQALRLLQRGYRKEDIRAAQARLASANAQLAELRAGSRKEDVRQAAAAAAAAARTARSARENLGENRVIAPIDGIVERIPTAAGDLVNAGTTLMRLSDPRDLWLRIYVPEAQLRSVFVGARCSIRIDGAAQPLPAVVESVSTQGEFTPVNLQTPDDRGKQVFGVRLRLDPPDNRAKAGMSATVVRIGGWSP